MPHDDARPPAGDQGTAVAGETTPIVEATGLEAWVAEQKAAREARHAHRRAWLKKANHEHREARAYGLRARQALALNRRRKGTTT